MLRCQLQITEWPLQADLFLLVEIGIRAAAAGKKEKRTAGPFGQPYVRSLNGKISASDDVAGTLQ